MFFYRDSIGDTIHYAELQGYYLLSKEEEFELIKKAQAGSKEAEETLIYSNVKLVASCIKKYNSHTLTKEDLFQEGLFGLYDAIYKFDTSKGFRFGTYATWFIRHRISRSISNKDRVIRIPVYITENIKKIMKAEEDFLYNGVNEPTLEDLSDATGIDVKNIERARANKDVVLSLDVSVSGKDDSDLNYDEFFDMNVDNSVLPEDVVFESCMKSDLLNLMSDVLNEREKEVISLKYGLTDDGLEHSISSISEKLGISKEVARQAERSGIKKLKKSKNKYLLIDYLA